MEGELWPEHLKQAQNRNIPTLLINARLSDKSFRRYQQFHFASKRLLAKVSQILASNEADAQRFKSLTTPEKCKSQETSKSTLTMKRP